MASRAWVDDADRVVEKELPGFLKQSLDTLPAWATTTTTTTTTTNDNDNDDNINNKSGALSSSVLVAGQKRFRDADLDALLARTAPLLTSRHDRQRAAAPAVISELPLPRDNARGVHWHRNGQLAIVAGNRHIYLFHAAGRFVERVARVDAGRRIIHTALAASGEALLLIPQQSDTPSLLTLATEQLVPLRCLCTRDSALYRNGRRDNGRHDFYISAAAMPTREVGDTRTAAIASGATVTIASLAAGSITHKIELSDPVVDMIFSGGPQELTVATRNKLTVYDLRRTAQFLRETCDDGTVDVTTFATSSDALAVGSASGVVSVYSKGTTGPVKTLKNLTTSISCMAFGERSNGDSVLAYSTKGQKGGFRLALLPECRVVPSFPAVAQRHHFIQSLTIAPTIPVLSVGEKQKVTNYAL